MRRSSIQSLAQDVAPADSPEDLMRAMLVENFGPRTAAWLIMRHRVHFHRRGVFDFKIPASPTVEQADKLRWFHIAIAFLKGRKHWSVETFLAGRVHHYRVRWLRWPHWPRQILS